MADTEIKSEVPTAQNAVPAQERPRFVKKQLDPAERARREQAWAELERLRAEISAAVYEEMGELTEEEEEALADSIVREAIDNLVRKGRIQFKSGYHPDTNPHP